MQHEYGHEYEVTAECPKKCGVARIKALGWCCYDKIELRCPKCNASKEVSFRTGWKLINQKDTKYGNLIGFIGRDQWFETPIAVGSPEHKRIQRRAKKALGK
jgi:hypothetical protein